MVGFRSMIHLCDEIVIMGPLGLIFLMYNEQIVRKLALKTAIAKEE